MALSVPLDELARRRVMIGTPMYEGMCHGAYSAALVELALRLRELGVAFRLAFIVNQPTPRARAMIVDQFLASDCTHLIFIDADIAFRAEDFVALLALQGDASPYDVIGGSYSRKTIDWDSIAAAAAAGVPAAALARFGGDPAVNLTPGTARIELDQPLEAETVAAGFSVLRRATIERLIAAFPDLAYTSDARERAGHGLSDTLYAFYGPRIDPVTRHYRSEDFAFCDLVREAGMKVWLCPWMHADHIGNHRFSGTFADAARLRATPQPTS